MPVANGFIKRGEVFENLIPQRNISVKIVRPRAHEIFVWSKTDSERARRSNLGPIVTTESMRHAVKSLTTVKYSYRGCKFPIAKSFQLRCRETSSIYLITEVPLKSQNNTEIQRCPLGLSVRVHPIKPS